MPKQQEELPAKEIPHVIPNELPAKEVPNVIPNVQHDLVTPTIIKEKAPSEVKMKKHSSSESESISKDSEGWPNISYLKKKRKAAPRANAIKTDYDAIDFNCSKKNADGKRPNLVLSSWNVDGVRAWINKNCTTYIEREDPDVFCMQVGERVVLVRLWYSDAFL